MVTPMPGGRRRIDRVLAPDFVTDLANLPMVEIRERRQLAIQEEADLSYVRRMLQGRLEILDQQLSPDGAESDDDLVARLTAALVPQTTPAAPGSSRHLVAEPSRIAERRRYVERLIGDIGLSDVATLDPDSLRGATQRLAEQERLVSDTRTRVHEVIDRLTAELGRRYQAGDV